MTQYDDEYMGCTRTDATFRAYHSSRDPSEVSSVLGIEPSRTQAKGDPSSIPGLTLPHSGWFLSSASAVRSRDLRRHLDWLADQLSGHILQLRSLRELGWRMDIMAPWERDGFAGPTLSPRQMAQIASLELDLWIPIHLSGESVEGGEAGGGSC